MIKLVKRLIIAFILLSVIPYLLPVSNSLPKNFRPYDNTSYYTINKTSIHYRQWQPEGDIKGKVLLVHGFGGSTFSFEKIISNLTSQGYLVVAVDLPGFGYSSRNQYYDHSQANRSKDLWKLLYYLDGKNNNNLPWTLLGHSMGGNTVAQMALADPKQTTALIIVDGAFGESGNDFMKILVSYPPVFRWLEVISYNLLQNKLVVSTLLKEAYGRKASPEEITGYLEPLELPNASNTLPAIIKTQLNLPLEAVKDLQLKTLIIWGGQDKVIPLAEGEKLQLEITDSIFKIIENGGHIPMETQPQEFNEIINEFINQK